jgi:hypothetical protein
MRSYFGRDFVDFVLVMVEDGLIIGQDGLVVGRVRRQPDEASRRPRW